MVGAPANSFFVTLDKLDKIGWSGVREQIISRSQRVQNEHGKLVVAVRFVVAPHASRPTVRMALALVPVHCPWQSAGVGLRFLVPCVRRMRLTVLALTS